MSTDIKDIRAILTDIKPLVERDYEDGSQASVAAYAARQRLMAIRAELEQVQRNLHQWQPGPSETK